MSHTVAQRSLNPVEPHVHPTDPRLAASQFQSGQSIFVERVADKENLINPGQKHVAARMIATCVVLLLLFAILRVAPPVIPCVSLGARIGRISKQSPIRSITTLLSLSRSLHIYSPPFLVRPVNWIGFQFISVYMARCVFVSMRFRVVCDCGRTACAFR